MKRYILFGYEQYYPSGGMNDYIGDYDTVSEALMFLEELDKDEDKPECYHIYDIKLDKTVLDGYDDDDESKYDPNVFQIETDWIRNGVSFTPEHIAKLKESGY
jgi:hypothetical protein